MSLHYSESGSGDKTLIFLHYFGGASGTWNEVISLLQNEFRCIAIDLLGFGESTTQTEQISVDNTTDSLVLFLKSLDLANYILIGHSMGGKIALNFTARQPKGIQSLLLIAPSPPTAEPMEDGERSNMYEAYGDKKAIEKMINNVIANPLPAEAFNKEVGYNLEVSEVAWHSWPQLGSKEDISYKMKDINIPLAIICGAKDKKFTKTYLQREFSHYFPSFSLTEIAACGHLLPVEAPEKIAMEIRKLFT